MQIFNKLTNAIDCFWIWIHSDSAFILSNAHDWVTVLNATPEGRVDEILQQYEHASLRTQIPQLNAPSGNGPPVQFVRTWSTNRGWHNMTQVLSQGETPAGKHSEKLVDTYYSERKSTIHHSEQKESHYRELGAQYAQLILRTLILLHGGAILLLPTLAEVFFGGSVYKMAILGASSYFIYGIILAIVSALVAYINFLYLEKEARVQRNGEIWHAENRLYATLDPAFIANRTLKSLKLHDRELQIRWVISSTFYIALALGAASLVFLIIGAAEIRSLFEDGIG